MVYDEIKRVIESCHLNFLIGSGASDPYLKILGKVENQLNALRAKEGIISGDTYKVIDSSIKQYYFENCIEGNLNIVTGSSGGLEETQNDYDAFLKSLNTILIKRRNNLVSKQVNLFTTNMDIFLDWSLEKLNLSYNDGFMGRLNSRFGTDHFHNTIRKTSSHYDYHSEVPHFNLFKLHGSVNWKLDGTNILYDHELELLSNIKHNKLSAGEILDGTEDDVNKLVSKLTVTPIAKSVKHDTFLEEYNKLVMINPTSAKFETTTRDLTFYELLRMYSNHLERENSVLFVMGFSFADEHIREITKRVAVSNPTLLIVVFAYNNDSYTKISGYLGEYPNVKFIYDESDSLKYSLKTINENFFRILSTELNKELERK